MNLTFQNAQGRTLAARLDEPAAGRPPLAYALFAHCFTCSKDLRAARSIARALCEKGLAVLRFDFTGLGESEGDFGGSNFSSNVSDLVAAAAFLEEDYEAPALLVGHSLGGAAVLRAAAQIESVRAVATIAAPFDPGHAAKLFKESLEKIRHRGAATVCIGERPFTIQRQLLEDLSETNMETAIHGLGRALLLFHSPLDNAVGIEHATSIFKAARHPKSFVSLDQADHLLTDAADAAYVGAVTAAWAARYVGAAQSTREQAAQEHGAPGEHRVVARTKQGGLRTELLAGRHALVADEPADVPGGTDAGPTPYDYLGAALGACTSMTLQMYAGRKGWPLEEAVTRVAHSKIHAEDCAACETREGKIDRLEREVEAVGPLSEEQRRRLLEIANKCPVHRTLEGEIDVQTRLREAAPAGTPANESAGRAS